MGSKIEGFPDGSHDYDSAERFAALDARANKIRNKVSNLMRLSQVDEVPYTLRDPDLLSWMHPDVSVQVTQVKSASNIAQPFVAIVGRLVNPSRPKYPGACLQYHLDFSRDGQLLDTSAVRLDIVAATYPHPEQRENLTQLSVGEEAIWQAFTAATSELGQRHCTAPLVEADLVTLQAMLNDCYPFD